LRELHIDPALVEPQPAALDAQVETGLVLGRAAAQFVQERPVDQLDVDAAVLHRLDGIGDLYQLGQGSERRKQSYSVEVAPLRTRQL